ncbi:GtrA family protein [Spirulina sp. CS-785/01]|uniref:GtrA family protein n=1 Tax=Spirulina sp. CS-785/01 TaxID=3021716 RepID=UPI00232F005D|nr:GtrA family protein [Spirulina sp. CS-785/01]MDB9315156.1 GtrA family protein [Spirulina sp. CS-785/01]
MWWAKFKTLSPQTFFANSMVRWWIVGLFFTGINIPLLYVFKEWFVFNLFIATFLASEIGTICRFFVNDRWVFGHPRPTWKRLWQYHVAISSSFVIWYSAANYLPRLGIHYLIAAILATCLSVGWSMITNFLWIWRKKQK